ncbi:MAG: hypothetical protein ACODAQ_05830 [Phycisphaeraceae bacterium]
MTSMTFLTTLMTLTPGGWIMMVLAVGGMSVFLAWCVYKVVSTPQATEHLHSQADIHPPDEGKD